MGVAKKLLDLAVKAAREAEAAPLAARSVAKAAPRPRQKPVVRTDNPGGEWLKSQRRRAEESRRPVSGAVTGYLKRPIELDPQKLAVIPGASGERRVPGDPQYDNLRPLVEAEGLYKDSPILVGINHRGEPYIIEGNTRAAVARDLGIDRIPAEVRYFAGGEQVGGLMEPGLLEHYMPPSELSLDPNFRRWFEGSKGVDEYGEPRRFYHGRGVYPEHGLGDFSTFDRMAAVTKLRKPVGMDTVGSWFSDRADELGAGQYAGYYGDPNRASSVPGAIMPVYLKYNNPWNTTFDEFLDTGNSLIGRDIKSNPRGRFDTEPLRQWLRERGNDAIQFPRGQVEGDQNVTVVLDPTQIKSAIGNRGTYDPNDPDINKARGGLAVKPVWDKKRPEDLGKPKSLSVKRKKSAKARAAAAGRPYPNAVDNIAMARKR